MARARHPRPAVVRAAVEPLEDRRHCSVSLNAAGWTVVTPSASARHVYVSSSRGSDNNSGLSPSAPVKTLAAATALVRNGTDDQLLLARGDTWTTSFPQWTKSGVSAADPMLIGTYGSGARPVIATGTGSGFIANSRSPVNDLVMQGLVFIATGRDPDLGPVAASAAAAAPIGLQLLGPSTAVTVEDSGFLYFGDNVDLEGGMGAISNVTIRRSTIADSYGTSAHAQGLFAANLSGLTLDQDTFDHNGWNAAVAGAGQNVTSHDIYCYDTVAGLTVTNSVIADAAFAGIMARGGGTIDGNLFVNNAIAVSFGNANGAESTAGGVRGHIDGNVVMGDHGIGTTPYGGGFEVGNTAKGAGVTVSGNVLAGDTQNSQPAINLNFAAGTTNPAAAVGLNSVTVASNVVYGWSGGIETGTFTDGTTGVASLNGLVVTGNHLTVNKLAVWHQGAYAASAEAWSNNTYSSTAASTNPFYLKAGYLTTAGWQSAVEKTAKYAATAYVDPSRTVAKYAGTVGLPATAAAFVSAAMNLSDANWAARDTAAAVIAYVKAGFAVATADSVATPALVAFTAAPGTLTKPTDGNRAPVADAPLSIDSNSRRASSTSGASTTAPHIAPATPVLARASSPVTARNPQDVGPGGAFGDLAAMPFFG